MPMQVSIPGNETDLIFTIITHPLLSILSSLRPLLEVTDTDTSYTPDNGRVGELCLIDVTILEELALPVPGYVCVRVSRSDVGFDDILRTDHLNREKLDPKR